MQSLQMIKIFPLQVHTDARVYTHTSFVSFIQLVYIYVERTQITNLWLYVHLIIRTYSNVCK